MSRLIKSQWAVPVKKENKVISIKVIKQEQQSEEQPIFVHYDIERDQVIQAANLEAEAIIAEAHAYANSIKRQIDEQRSAFEEEKIQITDQAKESGYSDGYQIGMDKGYEEVRETLLFAREVVDTSKLDYQNKIESSEKTILDIGLKVAEKIIGTTLQGKSEEFLSVVKRALKEARDYREIQLQVNPYHYGFLVSQKDELMKIFPKETEFYIYPDEDLPENGCIIESANGRIDASVDQQLEEIKDKLFELLESE